MLKGLCWLSLFLLFVYVNASCAPVSSPQTGVPPTTPGANEPGSSGQEVVYQADWSSDFNGWSGDDSWKVLRGMLLNDGTENPARISVPFKPGERGLSDYAVEAEIQVVGKFNVSGDRSFRMILRSGYWVGIDWHSAFGNRASIAVACPCKFSGDNEIAVTTFEGDSDWHTYRAEVYRNEIRLLVDGREIVKAIDNRYLEGGEIELWSANMQISVQSFKVIKL